MKANKMSIKKWIAIFVIVFIGFVMMNFKWIKNHIEKEPVRPNILWIMTDEQRTCSLGCYGSDWAKTPNIDMLATKGTVFTRAFPQCPQCVPSRDAQLTSRYPQEVNCTFNQYNIPFPEGTKTFVDIFNEAGYQTVTFGKQDNSWPVKWEKQKRWVMNNKYAGFFDLNKEFDPVEYKIIKCGGRGKNKMIRAGIYPGGNDNPSRNITDWAIDFLKTRDKKRPFLLRISHNYPHTPVLPSKPWDTLYKPDDIPIRYVDLEAMHTRSKWDQMSSSGQKMNLIPKDDYDKCWQAYMGLCAQVDNEVGRVIKTLNDLGLKENTIIIYSSDHGACLGEFGQPTKRTFDDCSWRVPFVWSWPGHIPEGQKNNDLADLISTGKTLLSLCGLKYMTPKSWRGRDIFNDPPPPAVFAEIGYPNMNSVVGKKNSTRNRTEYEELRVAIRTSQYRMDYSLMKNGERLPLTDGNLFDMVNDPGEIHNLWNEKKYHKVKKSLAKQIDKWFKEIDKPATLFGNTIH